MTLYINPEVAVHRCYIIAVIKILDIFKKKFWVELVKLGNECLQLYKHSTPLRVPGTLVIITPDSQKVYWKKEASSTICEAPHLTDD